MLPQGIFSVAVTTVMFPTLARLAARRAYDDLRATMANGMRQITLLLIPAAAAILVLSEPMVRLVYQRGEFDAGPDRSGGDGAVLVRLLAALQRPLPAADPDLLQPPAALGAQPPSRAGNLAITALAALALYGPFDVGGIVAATVIATAASVLAQTIVLRRQLGRLELGELIWTTIRVGLPPRRSRGRATASGTCSTRRSVEGWGARSRRWRGASLAGAAVYAAAITLLRIPEAEQIWRLFRRRDA